MLDLLLVGMVILIYVIAFLSLMMVIFWMLHHVADAITELIRTFRKMKGVWKNDPSV